MLLVQGNSGEIVDSEAAGFEDPINLLKPYDAAIISFERATSYNSAIMQDEYKRVKEFAIPRIEGDVYENLAVVLLDGCSHSSRGSESRLLAVARCETEVTKDPRVLGTALFPGLGSSRMSASARFLCGPNGRTSILPCERLMP